MYILWSFFLGVGLAMDAFAVSISNSIRYKLDNKKMILIALLYAVFQGLMPTIGYTFSELLKNIEWFGKILPIIGCIVLLFLGIKTIVEAVKSKKEVLDENEEKKLGFKLLIIQAIATSIDALTVGIGLDNTISASFIWQVIIGIIIIILVTFIICFTGLLLGKVIGVKNESNAEIIGGIILILIAVKIFIEFLINILK